MSLSTTSRAVLAAALTLLVASVAGAVVEVSENASLEFPLLFETATPRLESRSLESDGLSRSSIGQGWQVHSNVYSDFVRAGYGGDLRLSEAGVRDDVEAEALARGFLVTHPEMFGTRPDNTELRNVKYWRGRYAAHYAQNLHGIEVWKSDAFVLLGENGRLTAFGSTFFPEHEDLSPVPSLSAQDAIASAAQALNATPRTDQPIETTLYWVPAPSDEMMELTLAYRVMFETETPFGKWESFVHAGTGEILGRRNFFLPVNVTGHVEASVQNRPPSLSYCDGAATENLSHLTVSVSGGNSAATDLNGDFDIPHGGSASVSVNAQLVGPYIDVRRFSGLGSDASITQSVTPGVPATFSFTGANSRQDERDTFFHGNRVRDFMVGLDPTFTMLDLPVITTVGRTDVYCPGNAWYSLGAGQMNFCEQGGGYGNTGEMANVVYHEYGHGITDVLYVRNGAPQPGGGLHEGNSDVVANFLDRNSIIGLGFYLNNCTSGIRDADNGLTYPAYNENGGHTDGQVIAGFHWEAWQTLLGVLPQAEADQASFDAWHYGRDLGSPQTFPAQVLWTFMADDDDAFLGNGTPHYDAFCAAAVSKGFTCPTITVGVLIDHTPVAHQLAGAGTTSPSVEATIVSTAGALNASEIKLHYRLNGGSFTEVVMTPSAEPDGYTASIPALAGSNEVEYYLSAADLVGNSATSPGLAPAELHAFDVAREHDNLESGAGTWTAGIVGDNATTGQWGLFDPIGTAAQPEDDSTPAPGTMCFITGQCSGANCGGGCTLGCNDIDGGTTTLLSPVYNLSGLQNVRVKYDRWYSNNTGAEPNADNWVVDVSNNGGGSWTNVENTTASSAQWTTISVDIDALFGSANQVQLRFRASDLAGGSIVEAGVDELRILADVTGAVDAPIVAAGLAANVLALESAQPNPFSGTTRIEYAVPSAGAVDLAVYNVSGQVVRTLATGVREAGRYTAAWDGRDNQGAKVSSGVYFYRLTAGSESLTRKMTVMK